MIRLDSWHNWAVLAGALIVVSFLLRQLAARWAPAATVVKASLG